MKVDWLELQRLSRLWTAREKLMNRHTTNAFPTDEHIAYRQRLGLPVTIAKQRGPRGKAEA
jgi:hypothetical protein